MLSDGSTVQRLKQHRPKAQWTKDNLKLIREFWHVDIPSAYLHFVAEYDTKVLQCYLSILEYIGTLPYDHPVNVTTSLLWPLCSGLKKKLGQTISYLKNPFNTTTPFI